MPSTYIILHALLTRILSQIKFIICVAAFPLPKKFRVQPSFFGSPMSFCLSSLPLPDGNVNILYFFDMGIIYRRGGRPRPPTHTNNHRKFRGIFTTANQNNFNELIAVPCTAVPTALIKIIPSSVDEGIDFIFYSYYCVIVPRGVRYMF